MTQGFPPPHFQYVKSALQGLLFQGEHIPFPDCGSIGTLSQVPGLTEARILTGVTDQLFSPVNRPKAHMGLWTVISCMLLVSLLYK